MKILLSPTDYTFSASAKTITFTAPPNEISNVLSITNVTRGVIYFLPQAALTGTLDAAVLTLAATTSTDGHADNDDLQIIIEDGREPALETGGNLAGIRTDLGTDGTTPPALPGGSTGVRGWLRYLASLIPGAPFAVTGTFWPETQPISGNVTISNSSVEISNDAGNPVPVSASTLPLPNGASTSDKQDLLYTLLDDLNSHTQVNKTYLSSLVRSIGQTLPDIGGRIRVVVDSGVAVSTVSTVTTVSNQSNLGGYSAADQIPALMHLSADSLRRNISIT
ncbi:MAG: hypothetical protein ACKOPT_06690 [Cyanobium sp.]